MGGEESATYLIYIISLVLISVFIILVIFCLGVLVHKKFINKREVLEKEEVNSINLVYKKTNSYFLMNETHNLYKEWKDEFKNISSEINVSNLNKKYKSKVEELISSKQYKSIVLNESNDFYKESIFLEELSKISPFIWEKKFKYELEEYYS